MSYFEWVQGLQNYFWTEDQVNKELTCIMQNAFKDVMHHSKSCKSKINNRTAAYCLAVSKIAKAIQLRGIFP